MLWQNLGQSNILKAKICQTDTIFSNKFKKKTSKELKVQKLSDLTEFRDVINSGTWRFDSATPTQTLFSCKN